ncbi:MAG: carboxypeptidase-like regulatory domain-containing protein [Cyclobacteriaceae bacterium]
MRITINKPCSQKWESFPKNGSTGYCSACDKQVIDFTGSSRQSVEKYLATHTGRVCGRFRKEQLDPAPAGILVSGLTPVILATGLTLAASQSYAQTHHSSIHTEQVAVPHTEAISSDTGPLPDSVEITGRVVHEDGTPASYADVFLSLKYTATTDADGVFTIVAYEADSTLYAHSSSGTLSGTITIPTQDILKYGKVTLAEPVVVVQEFELFVTGGIRRVSFYKRWWYGLRYFIRNRL